MEHQKQNEPQKQNKIHQNQKPKSSPTNSHVTHDVGDFIEHIGDRIEQSGFKTVGHALEKVGDTIEHSQDEKKETSNKSSKSSEANSELPVSFSNLFEKAKDFEEQLVQFVKNKPFTVLAGALLVGFLGNRLLSYKSSESDECTKAD